jgi:ribonuclease VapC
MIVDSSALVAIAFQEPGCHLLIDRISSDFFVGIGTPTLVQTGIILGARLQRDAEGLLGRLKEEFELVEIPFGEWHWREALGAYWRFGRGRHPANLTMGECCAYAVARLAHEGLLHLNPGFSATDLPGA